MANTEGTSMVIEALVRKVERIETNVDWIKKNMERDEKHFDQVYKNKEEIQKVKTVGGVLFALLGLISTFFGFSFNK